MALSTKAGKLAVNRSTTGRDTVRLPDVVSVVGVFINISGTATVAIEVADDPSLPPIEVKRVTTSALVRVFPPCSVLSTNVISVSGTVNSSFRAFITDDIVGSGIESFEGGVIVQPTLNTSTNNDQPQILAQNIYNNTSMNDLYTVPAGKRVSEIVLIACNQDGSNDRQYSVALSKNGAALVGAHYIAFGKFCSKSDSHIWHIGYLNAADIVRVGNGVANQISFNLLGILRDA